MSIKKYKFIQKDLDEIPLFGTWYRFIKSDDLINLQFIYTKEIKKSVFRAVLVLENIDDYRKFTFLIIILGSWNKISEFYYGIEFLNVDEVKKGFGKDINLKKYSWIKNLKEDCGCYWNNNLG